MSAMYGLSRTRVTITPAGGGDQVVHEDVGILVRGGHARVRRASGKLVVEKAAVLSSARLDGRNNWLTTFADGETWQVTDKPSQCLSCGG